MTQGPTDRSTFPLRTPLALWFLALLGVGCHSPASLRRIAVLPPPLPSAAKERPLSGEERDQLLAAAGAFKRMLQSAPNTSGLPLTRLWTPLGPRPICTYPNCPEGQMISGNIRALAVDPTNPDIVYLGANSGGVWKSVDGGTTWNPVTDSASSLQISSIAIDPSNRNTIYAGTVLMILKSTDGGTSWAELPQFIAPLARAAVAAGVDGIFVEVQDAPERALSDGANALRLDLLGDFWRSLTAINALVKAGARTK